MTKDLGHMIDIPDDHVQIAETGQGTEEHTESLTHDLDHVHVKGEGGIVHVPENDIANHHTIFLHYWLLLLELVTG